MSRLSSSPLRQNDRPLYRVPLRSAVAAALLLLVASACFDDVPTGPPIPRALDRPAWLVTGSTEVDIGSLGWEDADVRDMNDAGQIVGVATVSPCPDPHDYGAAGFLWSLGEGMQPIATGCYCEKDSDDREECEALDGYAFAINSAGTVTGSEEWSRAYRRPGEGQGPYGAGWDINDAGDVVGGFNAYVWTADGTITGLGTLPGQSYSIALWINNARQVAGTSGTRGFFWQNGTMQDLGTLGGNATEPTDLNEAGQVVGQSSLPNGSFHAFVWSPGGGMVDLGTLGGANSRANAVNASGQVVGWSETASGQRHAFIWKAGEGMTDMGTLPIIHDPQRGTPNPALSSSEALDINDAGEVTGFSIAGYYGPYAYIWTRGGGMQILGYGFGKVINNNRQVAGGAGHPDYYVDGHWGGRFWHNIVVRVGPTVDAGGPYAGSQGKAILFDGSGTTNPDGDSLVLAWDFTGDGVPDATGVQVGFAYAAAGSYTVRLSVTDGVGVTWTDSATVTVGPPRWPQAVIAPPPGGQYTIREGTRITLSSQGSAGENGGPLLYRWEFGDGTRAQSVFQTTPFNWGKVYGDDGTYTARLVVRDTAGRADTATINVVVSNTAPQAVLGMSSTVFENSPFALSLVSATDSSAADRQAGFTYAFDCGAGSGYGAFGTSATGTCHSRVNDTTYTVGGRIRDKDGGVRQYTRALTARDARPAINGTDWSAQLLVVSFEDPGTNDGPWSWVVSWGDGTSSSGTATYAGVSITAPHVYAASGSYTARIQVYDRLGTASLVYPVTLTQ
jgi:probable HAF family extracellular repeat protein